jgi:hypothetical protein
VTLKTVVATAGIIQPQRGLAALYATGMPVIGLLGIAVLGSSGKKKWSGRRFLATLGLVFLVSLMIGALGCGGGFNNPGNLTPPVAGSTPAGTYIVTLTGTDPATPGTPVAVVNIPLNVQF